MQIKFTSVMVDDQEKALGFYTKVLGFRKMADLPFGEFRWLTVTSPEGMEGVELVLEPMGFPPARDFQRALYGAGIPATAFTTRDVAAEHRKLKARGVVFRGEPVEMGPIKAVLFEDGCGNLLNLVQPPAGPEPRKRPGARRPAARKARPARKVTAARASRTRRPSRGRS